MKEAILWHKEGKNIRCELCGRRCLILENGLGFCLVRKNIKGTLYSLNYGKIISSNIDPIEKKPLFHFLSGSQAFSVASAGCNFACKYCCNWEISQIFRDKLSEEIVGTDYSPKQIVDFAFKNNCQSISYTYTEPTIFFEFAYDTAKLAHKKNLKNTFVTNGYMTPEAVEKISPFLDAATVDFKGSANEKFYREFASVSKVEPIFECLKEMKKRKIHIEITDLIVPKVGDKEEDLKKLAKWVFENLGKDIPFHILRFFPNYRVLDIPETSIEILEKFYGIAKEIGLDYVYLGNVPGHSFENTYCPNCKKVVIERFGFHITKMNLEKNCCSFCGEKIAIVY